MKVLSIANFKGGCGKTTTAYHLGKLMAGNRVKTLLIDLDPQHNLTERFHFQTGASIADVLGGAAPALNLTHAVIEVNKDGLLHLVPSEFNLANVALGLLSDVVKGRTALRRALRAVAGQYGLVIIDCPPEAGILLANALLASDGVLLPAEPERDALAGVKAVFEMASAIRDEFERAIPVVLGTVAARVDARTNRHADGLAIMEASSLAPLWGQIPERNGQLRDQELTLAYAPVAEKLCDWLEV